MSEQSQFNLAETAALGAAISSSVVADAKKALADQATIPVDFTVRVRGQVSKGVSTPGNEAEVAQRVNVYDPAVVHTLLLTLGVTREEVADVLDQIVQAVLKKKDLGLLEADERIGQAFGNACELLVQNLPKQKASTKPKHGAVTFQGTAERVEPKKGRALKIKPRERAPAA